MTHAIFIRHGQSTANVGEPTKNFAKVPLTELGWEQARTLAESWKMTPSRIVVSPFLRTQQTAEATIVRFPEVAVETWPIYEFTFWDPDNWTGGEAKDMMHEVDRYWHRGDPELRFGRTATREGAESFAMMLGRAEDALRRLEAMQENAPVLLFTHGHFIQALRLTALHPGWSAREKMREFRTLDEERWVMNTQQVPAEFDGTLWKMD
jgi:broad specificity phosphatase PhoE